MTKSFSSYRGMPIKISMSVCAFNDFDVVDNAFDTEKILSWCEVLIMIGAEKIWQLLPIMSDCLLHFHWHCLYIART